MTINIPKNPNYYESKIYFSSSSLAVSSSGANFSQESHFQVTEPKLKKLSRGQLLPKVGHKIFAHP